MLRKRKNTCRALMLILAILLTALMASCTEAALNTGNEAAAYEQPAAQASQGNSVGAPAVSDGPDVGLGLLTVTFIDVGQADATLLEQGGMAMLIDGGSPEDSNLIFTVLRDRGIERLDHVIATHAHADHVGGLSGALRQATAGAAWCPVTDYDTRAFRNFVSGLEDAGSGITVPEPGTWFMLGTARVEFLGPSEINEGEPNDTSLIIKVTHGDVSFLFTGDAERNAELRLVEEGRDLSADVIHVGHHGSSTSSAYPFLREVMPLYAVISCGRGNQYGHPHEDVMSRLRDAGAAVYRTDMQGDITAVSDGASVSFVTARNADAVTNPGSARQPEDSYIGNANSLKFHRQSCTGLPAEHNRVTLGSLEEAYEKGFDPCGICRP